MATKIEKTKKKAILLGGQIDYAKKIIAALGDPQKWEYKGECLEDETVSSTCACGHTGIRYLFIIHHVDTGATKILGSTCICHYALINEEIAEKMADDFQKLQEQIKTQQAASKKAQELKEVGELVARYESALLQATKLFYHCFNNNIKYSRALSMVAHWRKPPEKGHDLIKKYTRPCDMKRNLKKHIEIIDGAIKSQADLQAKN